MSPYMFPVNNMTELDATLDHSLNKDWNHWEAGEELASSRSANRTAKRPADMSFHQWWLTLAWGEAAGWIAVGQVVVVVLVVVVEGLVGVGRWRAQWISDFMTGELAPYQKMSRWKNKRKIISTLMFLLCVCASRESIDTGASTNNFFIGWSLFFQSSRKNLQTPCFVQPKVKDEKLFCLQL